MRYRMKDFHDKIKERWEEKRKKAGSWQKFFFLLLLLIVIFLLISRLNRVRQIDWSWLKAQPDTTQIQTP